MGVETRFVLDTNTALTNVLMDTDSSGTPLAYNVYGQGLIARILTDESVLDLPLRLARQHHCDHRCAPRPASINTPTTPSGASPTATAVEANPFGFLGRLWRDR